MPVQVRTSEDLEDSTLLFCLTSRKRALVGCTLRSAVRTQPVLASNDDGLKTTNQGMQLKVSAEPEGNIGGGFDKPEGDIVFFW